MDFNGTNYSVEINQKGKLSSVKIKDTYSATDDPDLTKIPSFETVAKVMNSKSNSDIESILAPDIEIYEKNKTVFFNKSIRTEINTDSSYVFGTIRRIAKGLDKIDTKDSTVYDENMRFMQGQNVMHVIKIYKGAQIKEIVFKYINGRYRIYEIATSLD